jgi:hypothetical protein
VTASCFSRLRWAAAASLLVGVAWTSDAACRLLSGRHLFGGTEYIQSAIAIVAVAAGRLFGPVANINYAFVEPLLKRTWGGPAAHVAAVTGFLVLLVYPVTHLLLARLLPKPRA